MKRKLLIAALIAGFFIFPDAYRQVGIFLKEMATLIILGK